ncbi:hypothetical protein ACVW0W_006146 [Bradyrhizobium sp. USDA 4469]
MSRTLVVGAEPPGPARRLLRVHEIGVEDGIGVRQPWREHTDENREREQRAADDEIGAELHAYLILGSITP